MKRRLFLLAAFATGACSPRNVQDDAPKRDDSVRHG